MDFLRPNSLSALRALARSVVRWMLLAAMISSACTAPARPLAAQTEGPTEYQVKAAFLFNFAKFVEWPDAVLAGARTPIVLGILGEDPFGNDLSLIVTGQSVRGRTVSIRKYRFGDDLRDCHILFVSASERMHMAQILASLQGASVLTVSDMPGFAGGGGVVQFYMEEVRVRFVVNVDGAARANLRVSAKLLAVAHVMNDVLGVR